MQRQESDLELMLRVRAHDSDAFAELMRRYRARLIPFFFSLCGDAELAEDLYQETFIRLWRARERYLPAAKFSTYLIEIAKNLWLNERARWRRRMEMASLDAPAAEERPDALRVAAADLRELPEQVLLRKERERRISEALEALPPHLSLVFTLSHFEGCKYREIAAMLGIADGTVKWRMAEATRRLRETLRDLWEEG
jgi:RNA polymerase sigma-70 factor (ECF subfamily)